jgi:hypothetical protein
MKKNKLNSKNPKYKSGRGYNDKEDENAKEKQTKILINETKGAKIYAVYKEQISS